MVACLQSLTSVDKHKVLGEVLEQIRSVARESKDGQRTFHHIEYCLTSWEFSYPHFKQCVQALKPPDTSLDKLITPQRQASN